MSKFVIREIAWGYDDEVHYPSGSALHSVFDDKAKAEAAFKKLEAGHWRNTSLLETSFFFHQESDNFDEKIEEIDLFLDKKGLPSVFDDPDDFDTHALSDPKLSDDDILYISNIAELKAYDITEFEDDIAFYAIWHSGKDEGYEYIHDECFKTLIYESSIEQLVKEHIYIEKASLKGDLESLSDTPDLLKSLIESQKKLSYNEEKKVLKFNKNDTSSLIALNELLKEPLFEVRKLSLEQIKEIESNCYE